MSQRRQKWKSPDDMTDRQWHFVAEYALSGNAADAARKAGYAPKSARKAGSRLLTYRYIRQALAYYTIEQITQCKRPLRKALRNLERHPVKDWNMLEVHKLHTRLVALAEPVRTSLSNAENPPYKPDPPVQNEPVQSYEPQPPPHHPGPSYIQLREKVDQRNCRKSSTKVTKRY